MNTLIEMKLNSISKISKKLLIMLMILLIVISIISQPVNAANCKHTFVSTTREEVKNGVMFECSKNCGTWVKIYSTKAQDISSAMQNINKQLSEGKSISDIKKDANLAGMVDIGEKEELKDRTEPKAPTTPVTTPTKASSTATNIMNALFDGFMGIVLLIPKFGCLLIGLFIQGLGSLLLTGIEGAGEWFTPDNMIFNRLQILSVNFFDIASGMENTPLGIIRINVRDWYYAIRNLATGALLATLAYIGIRMALSTLSEDKAKYKKLLRYWIESFVLLWMLQFIMILIIEVNNQVVALIDKAAVISGFDSDILLKSVLDQSLAGFASAFCYVAWVGMAAAFFLMYLKRLMVVGFLIVIAPIITITYSIDKVKDGQSQALNNWIRQFMYNVLIQIFHCILYLVFVSSVISLLPTLQSNNIPGYIGEFFKPTSGTQAMITAVITIPMMLFIWKAEKILKEIFGFNQADNTLMSGLVAGKMMATGAKTAKNMAKGTAKAAKKFDKATGSHISKKWNNSKLKNSKFVKGVSTAGNVIKDTGLWDAGKAAGRIAFIAGATGELTPGITYSNDMAKYDKSSREAKEVRNVIDDLKKELQDPKFKQQLDKISTMDDMLDSIQRGDDPNKNSNFNEFEFNNKMLNLYNALNQSGETGSKAFDNMWNSLKNP